MASNYYLDWDWSSEHVGGDINTGEYVTSESAIILAGPSRLELLNTSALGSLIDNLNDPSDTLKKALPLVLLGKTAQFDVQQSKNTLPMFEIGSKRAYILSEKGAYAGSLTGFLAYRDNLLKLMYSGWEDQGNGFYINKKEKEFNTYTKTDGVSINAPKDSPGYGMHYNALSSKLFTAPIGLAMIFRSNRDRSYSGLYLEDVVVDNYHIGFQSNQAIIMESLRYMAGFVKPMDISKYKTA
jgi:hypothetical protein